MATTLKKKVLKAPTKDRIVAIKRAASLLKQVSDPTRIQILLLLSDGARNVTSLCEAVDQSQPAVSHHLALLRHSAIVEANRDGKQNFYELTELGSSLTESVLSVVD
jgi:DNA-binding transcriptional ArsR family regulator